MAKADFEVWLSNSGVISIFLGGYSEVDARVMEPGLVALFGARASILAGKHPAVCEVSEMLASCPHFGPDEVLPTSVEGREIVSATSPADGGKGFTGFLEIFNPEQSVQQFTPRGFGRILGGKDMPEALSVATKALLIHLLSRQPPELRAITVETARAIGQLAVRDAITLRSRKDAVLSAVQLGIHRGRGVSEGAMAPGFSSYGEDGDGDGLFDGSDDPEKDYLILRDFVDGRIATMLDAASVPRRELPDADGWRYCRSLTLMHHQLFDANLANEYETAFEKGHGHATKAVNYDIALVKAVATSGLTEQVARLHHDCFGSRAD